MYWSQMIFGWYKYWWEKSFCCMSAASHMLSLFHLLGNWGMQGKRNLVTVWNTGRRGDLGLTSKSFTNNIASCGVLNLACVCWSLKRPSGMTAKHYCKAELWKQSVVCSAVKEHRAKTQSKLCLLVGVSTESKEQRLWAEAQNHVLFL